MDTKMFLSIIALCIVLGACYFAYELHIAPLMPDDYDEPIKKEGEIR